ncbi:MYPU_1760 family metalloprotease [Mycoplasmopsis glycophila]|uniref:Lipoprotein n=1 Tax=Mycoplasmopsis glycophila TaxID=171285 RepID=A0A449AWG7_9BACT|nr:hypothetical protein [Mycoplasmopsis glycophila]VEU71044.1 Uncharacterised protein [Mycoplasmopsis glycophila]
MKKNIKRRFLFGSFLTSLSFPIFLAGSCSAKSVPVNLETLTYSSVLETSEQADKFLHKINESEFLSLDASAVDQINLTSEAFKTTQEEDGKIYLEYIDPYTKIKFREYPLDITNNNATFLLGKEGLVILANEFKRKIPFSTEVFDLDSININLKDFNQEDLHGAYSDKNKAIYLFMEVAKSQKMLAEQIIAVLMPSLFHEYIHHVATSYFSNFDYYHADKNLTLSSNYTFNKQFIDQFVKLLNPTIKNPEKNNSLNDLIQFANFDQNEDKIRSVYSFSKIMTAFVNKRKIKYLYSYEEMIAREYTKYAFENYFNKTDKLEYNGVKASFEGLTANGKLNYYSYLFDWSRTLLFKNNDDILKDWSLIEPIFFNDLFKFNYEQKFYNLFLEYIGYGKSISQICYENNWKYIFEQKERKSDQIWLDDTKFANIKITGYLENNEYTGIAFWDKQNEQIIKAATIHYMPAFNFFGRKTYDQGARLSNQTARTEQIDQRLYPGYHYVPYYTDFINVEKLPNNLALYFYKDLNNDGQVSLDEILFDNKLTIPPYSLINLKGNLSYQDIDKVTIYQNAQNEIILHKINKTGE